jgi:hypothetical protein
LDKPDKRSSLLCHIAGDEEETKFHNSGAQENAANTVSGIIGDLDTTILFATAGTLNPDETDEAFAGLFNNALKM